MDRSARAEVVLNVDFLMFKVTGEEEALTLRCSPLNLIREVDVE